jgi:glycosyltransferase involved in cell wall biosynthesis
MYPFPNGMAATNRILAYGKGLVENGIEVSYFACLPPTKENLHYVPDSLYKGISCHYSYHRTKGNNKITSILRSSVSLLLSVTNLGKHHRKIPYDYLFISSDSIPFLSIFVLTAKMLNLKVVFIGDEYPGSMRTKLRSQLTLSESVLYKILHKGIDYRVLMTDYLIFFYNSYISYKPTYKLPSIIDLDRFKKKDILENNKKYICYMGSMDLSKDNIDNIIKAYFLIYRDFHDIELHFYGIPSHKDIQYLISIINNLHLEGKVIFKKNVLYNEVPIILKNAYILVTSQPQTKRTEGGFSTKLGEYLMSGRPTLLTDVGEIRKYIKDGENAYLVEPCNPQAYANKLKYIIEHYDEALLVAQKGKEYVSTTFSHSAVASDLLLFLNKHLE